MIFSNYSGPLFSILRITDYITSMTSSYHVSSSPLTSRLIPYKWLIQIPIIPIQSPANFSEARASKLSTEVNSNQRKLLDESVQKKIFDSEKYEERLQKSVQTLNQRMEELNRSVRFSVDRQFEKDIISVVNPDSGDVIRQIPPEAAMKVSEGVKSLRGMLFDDSAWSPFY